MVVGAFPAVKLGVLLFKQISKPIANFAKERAKNNRFFRTYVCMPPAQFYNWCEVKSKMWILNLGKPVQVPHLSEQMAIELGANLLGEGILFILGSVLVILEYNRSSKKEAAKEQERLEEMTHLNDTLNELYFTVQMQDTQIRELMRTIGDLETRAVLKPWAGKMAPKSPDEPPPPPSGGAASANIPIPQPKEVSGGDRTNKHTTTPYPDKGIVMRSLNYVELDILNTPQVVPEVIPELNEKPKQNVKYGLRPGVVREALQYIETDVKGLM